MSRTPTQILDDCCTELNAKGQAHISHLLQQVKVCFTAERDDWQRAAEWRLQTANNATDLASRLTAERDAAERALKSAGYTKIDGAAEWKPPLGPSASPLLDELDRLRKALEESKERFANLASGRCPAPPGTANDPVAFRDWAEGYALIGFNSVSIALATNAVSDAKNGAD